MALGGVTARVAYNTHATDTCKFSQNTTRRLPEAGHLLLSSFRMAQDFTHYKTFA